MNVDATMMTTLMEPLPKRSLITTRYMSPIVIITGTGISKKIIKCQRDIAAKVKIAFLSYQLLKSLSMEPTNLILNGMMIWGGLYRMWRTIKLLAHWLFHFYSKPLIIEE